MYATHKVCMGSQSSNAARDLPHRLEQHFFGNNSACQFSSACCPRQHLVSICCNVQDDDSDAGELVTKLLKELDIPTRISQASVKYNVQSTTQRFVTKDFGDTPG